MKLIKPLVLFSLFLSIQTIHCSNLNKRKQTPTSITSITSNPLLTTTTLIQGIREFTQFPQKLHNFSDAVSSLTNQKDLNTWAQAFLHGTSFSATTLAVIAMVFYPTLLMCKKDTRFSQFAALIFSLAMLPSACFFDEETSIFGLLWAAAFGGLVAHQYTQILKLNTYEAQDDEAHLL